MSRIEDALTHAGFVQTPQAETLQLLEPQAAADWDRFAQSWDDLGPDLYMADGGRYRRRRHAAFGVRHGIITRKPHQAHFQSRDYNALNGGIQRWFEPVSPEVAENAVTTQVLSQCDRIFSNLSPAVAVAGWHVELHQFRIEAHAGEAGRPTPEGLHRDGVDWAFVMLVARSNVIDGVTEIGDAHGAELGRFLLAEPGDAVFLDDQRIFHGVTPIHRLDPSLPGHRDVLVVTFVAASAA